jgi:hypothetical protein
MAPNMTTENDVVEKQLIDEYEKNNDCTEKNKNVNNHKSPYDEVLPKDDPAFMAPVRKWEKQLGFVTPIRWINSIAIVLFHFITVLVFVYLLIFHIERFRVKTVLFGKYFLQVSFAI